MNAVSLSWVVDHAGLLLALTGASLTLAAAAGLQLLRQRRGAAGGATPPAGANTQIDTQMQRDGLTGLLSRPEFEFALDDAVLRSDRGAGRLCVIYVDIDNLGSVNEAFGHAAGDAVLRESATRLVAGLGGALQAASRI